MLNALCYIYGKLSKDEVMVIRLPGDWETSVFKNDQVQKKGDAFLIYRKSGKITAVNPSQVTNVIVCDKKDWLL